MADHAADIKKYAPKADDAVIAKMESTYRLALTNADAAQVSFKDESEIATVKKNFLAGKLGVTDEAKQDEAIAAVAKTLADAPRKNRLTVYYLLAEQLGKLDIFK